MEEFYNVGFGIDAGAAGNSNPNDVKELAKALSVGYAYGSTDQTGFGATRVESIERTLKIATVEEKSATFWKALRKSKAESTVEEFGIMNEIGDANFYTEGGLPEEYDEDIRRELETVKYIGTIGRIPNVAMEVKSITNNLAVIMKAKAMAIIRKTDYTAFFGNSENVPTEWNGLVTQFLKRVKKPNENIIDLRGKHLTAEVFSDVGQIIQDNYGDPANLKGWLSVDAFNNYTKSLIKDKTFMVGNNEIRQIIASAKSFEVGNAIGDLSTDLHLRYKGQTYINAPHPKLDPANIGFAATHEKAPNTLTSTYAVAAVAALAGSQLEAATYDYAIVPVNKYGAGAAFQITGVVVGANEKVSFTTLADAGSPSGREATAFEIYRKKTSETGITQYRYLKTVKAGATAEDTGSDIPGTTTAIFWDWNFDQVLDFKQLLPMTKMDLAVIDDSYRWLQKLYATPILYNPNKMVVIKNVGKIPWA